MTSPLSGVDRATFAAALVDRLRRTGLDVGLPSTVVLVQALDTRPAWDRAALYWTARTILTSRQADLLIFDAVFDAVFADLGMELAHRGRSKPGAAPQDQPEDDAYAPLSAPDGLDEQGGGLPWVTLPPVGPPDPDGDLETRLQIHERLPSGVDSLAEVPFADLDPAQARVLHAWLETAFAAWPARRTRRLRVQHNGRHVDLRATLAAARRTGWEPAWLIRKAQRTRPRRVVLIADVSQSMQAQVNACLHLMHGAVIARDAEAFAFATRLSRITPALAHHDASYAMAQATEAVLDRFGGTKIASNLEALLRSRHGGVVRGAVVLIVSDGWDSDPPDQLGAVMARLHRRAHSVVWLNPRVAASDYTPSVGGMAAALPFCDQLLPAHDLRALLTAVDAISGRARGHAAHPRRARALTPTA